MQKTKVMTIVGTRPELIRLSRVLAKMDNAFEHIFVHTGQNYDYELNKVFFDDLGIRQPAHYLDVAGGSAAATIGRIIERTDALLESVQPEAVLLLGDTNSCLAAIPAKRRKIPIFHMEAGNRCFDQRVPEETNRKIVDHIADLNMPYSDIAREYLLREGLPPDRVVKTGSPMYEVLKFHEKSITGSDILSRLQLKPEHYFVVSCHREENVDSDKNLTDLAASLNALAAQYSLPIIMSTHPRTRKRLEEKQVQLDPLVQILKPMGFFDYVCLQQHSKLVLSDSGTITEESSILNFPALNIREAHERPEGMEEASVIMTGLRPSRVLEAAALAMEQPRDGYRTYHPVADYMVDNVSDKVVRIIMSYTDYINRTVWRK